MSGCREAPAAIVALMAGALLLAMSFVAPGWARRRMEVRNYRGAAVPFALGPGIALSVVGLQAVWAGLCEVRAGGPPGGTWNVLAAAAGVFLVGFADDLLPGGPRGLRGHAAALARGRASTGIVKVVVIVGASALVAIGIPMGVLAGGLGVVVMAAAANLWNGLDVAPGRALKWFLLVGIVLLVLGPSRLLAPAVGAAVPALWWDLRERAMLGDGGANLLGFVVGIALYGSLEVAGLAAAAAGLVTLNVLAETVTMTRLIRGFAPSRWFDDLGRMRFPPSKTGRPEPAPDIPP